MSKTIEQMRVLKVLENITALVDSDDGYAQSFSPYLDEMLDNLHGDDCFGTEGQADPRGDFRDGDWSMNHVQGVDACR